MTTRHSSSFDAEVIDNTLLSIPEVYIAYIHPTLTIALQLLASVLAYCILTITKLVLIAVKTILYPVYVIGHVFIVRPIGFFFHVCHLLYPVAVYLSFAVICGLVIGGCAGFTAEALSSFFINATWGPSPSRTKTVNGSNNKGYLFNTPLDESLGDNEDGDSSDGLDPGDYDLDDIDYEEEERLAEGKRTRSTPKSVSPAPQKHRFSAISSSLASIWKGTPELGGDAGDDFVDGDVDESDDGDGSDQDQGGKAGSGRRTPLVPIYSSVAAKDKQMMAKGKQAMRQLSFMTTNTTDGIDDNTPRYRVGKKAMAYDTE